MTWINVGDRLPTKEDGHYQLVVYLSSSWGKFTSEITTGYFDSPEEYGNPDDAEGWKDWQTDDEILVTHWQRLPELPTSRFDGIDQVEFKSIFGSFRPNLGSVIDVVKERDRA
jgi:hypothetical protein